MFTVHADAAVKHGATNEQLAEALGVATALEAGASRVYVARTLDAFQVQADAALAVT